MLINVLLASPYPVLCRVLVEKLLKNNLNDPLVLVLVEFEDPAMFPVTSTLVRIVDALVDEETLP